MPEPCEAAVRIQAAVRMRWGVRIPLRDGIHLQATLYLPPEAEGPPEEKGAAPAIVTMTPYIAQTWHDRGLWFAAHGMPFLIVDVRGRGNSEGEFRPNINEARDGYDVVEWVAQQTWCSGRVGMWGGSYGGYAQWAAAKEFPPHLATIVPVASPCMGIDFPILHNIAAPYVMQWLTLVSGRASQEKIFGQDQMFWSERWRAMFESGAPFRMLDERLGNPSPIFQEWLDHPHPDEYWDRYNPTADEYRRLSIPILTITGIYDGDQTGALAHYRAHLALGSPDAVAKHFLIIGPWDHAGTRQPSTEFSGITVGPASLVDLEKLHLEWYSWTMQGGARPAFLQNRVAYYVMVAEAWRYADSLEAITAETRLFYLQSDSGLHSRGNPSDVFHSGRLAEELLRESAPDHYVHDPRDMRLAGLESTIDPGCLTDQRMVHAGNGRQLIYHTVPFQQDVEVSGFFRLTAWLSIDQPDTDFRAVIYEVDGHGRSVKMTEQSIRARYREGLREERLIETPEPLRYEFAGFPFVSRLVRRGARLRLVIGPMHSIYSQRNHHTGGRIAEECLDDARVVTVKLFHDSRHPSALHVPFGRPPEGSR